MKKYYLHNGTDQQGPFDIEDLKEKSINKDTPIWHEGLSEWTTVEKVEELKDLFNTITPPPFTPNLTPPPITKQTVPSETKQYEPLPYEPEKKTNNGSKLIIAIVILVIIVVGIMFYNNTDKGSDYKTKGETYQEKVMTVEEIENSDPVKFLKASGNYNENIWGTKIKVHGVITNNATVATYKDALVRVTYYSKTKTKLGAKEYIIYEVFPPHSETKFELKIENYKDVDAIGWEVIQATAN